MLNYISQVIPFLGLVNSFLTIFFVYWVWVSNGRFSLIKHPLSLVGQSNKSKYVFIFVIALTSCLQLLFIWNLISKFPVLQNYIIYLLILAALFFLILSSTFPRDVFYSLHRLFVRLSIFLLVAWSMIFHIFFLSIDFVIGILGIFLSTIIVIGGSIILCKYKSSGLAELYFIFMCTLWNILMSYVLLIL